VDAKPRDKTLGSVKMLLSLTGGLSSCLLAAVFPASADGFVEDAFLP
jgi:hypothetical protein